VWCLDRDAAQLEGFAEHDLSRRTHGLHLAYCIYTSGSTGKPKGAGNSHRGLQNRLHWMQAEYQLSRADRVLQKTPFSFDVSVWEFFWPLLTGAAIVKAPPGAHRDPAELRAVIERHRVSTLHFVPSMLQAFVASGELGACPSVRQVLCSGEALPYELEQSFLRAHPARLHNLYGPTEAAIDVTYWPCGSAPERTSVPIGRPISNTGIYILDRELQPVPAGVAGELYIAGVGLARGYHRRPALTAERFVPHPAGEAGGERLYRTGDLARYDASGVIEYLGRLDHQVKVRGFRIELGEIEAQLLEQPEVREAAVLALPAGSGKQLVAYVVAAEPSEELPANLRAQLARQLPDYMVPSQFVLLPAMPLSPNGKLDRKALPELGQVQKEYLAPQTELEQQLAEVWQQVLGRERVGLSENFFELGGDSIVSLQLVGRARQLGIQITPRDLFQHPTVQGLAGVATRGSRAAIDQGPVRGALALTPIQRWFFERPMTAPQHFNQALLLQPRQALEAEPLELALRALIEHHDALRLRFRPGADGQWTAEHAESAAAAAQAEPITWQRPVQSLEQLSPIAEEAQRSLQLASGPLLRAVLICAANGEQRLLLVVHHLVVDGVSWRVLLEDLERAYWQLSAGQAARLPAKTSSFQSWSERLRQHAASESLQQERAYWLAQVGSGPAEEVPRDHAQGANLARHAESISSSLSVERTLQLREEAPRAYRTQINDLLLAALARVLCRASGQPSFLVALEGHGREDLFDGVDLSRSVGWFTSLFPARLQADLADDDGSVGRAIQDVKEQLRAIPQRGLGYGLLRYSAEPEQRREFAALPVPGVTFNHLGDLDAGAEQGKLFALAGEGVGTTQAPDTELMSWLTLNTSIREGRLSARWTFSRECYRRETIERLAQAYLLELERLVEHCLASAGGATPSDFPLAGLSREELDSLGVAWRGVEDL
jgi:amino acid adenylation domain-containing protein/non-ribosomal peptide synthase protein (TIGR01720 family)